MRDKPPARHSVSTLCYRLIEGPVCLAPLRILATREIAWAACNVTIYVLGTSHAIVIENGLQTVTELLTCCPPVDACSVIRETRVLQSSTLSARVSGFACRSRIKPFELFGSWRPPGRFSSANSLRVGFPPNGIIAPETAICWEVSANRLIVETIHTYPEEDLGMLSRSEFEVVDATS